MRAPGLHYTLNEGFAWKPAAAQRLTGEPRALAVHPIDVKTVAAATTQGLFLSRDAGARFVRLAANGEGLSAFFDLEGMHLWYGSFDGKPRLSRIPLGGGEPQEIQLPLIKDDAVAYIAQNPRRKREYAIATFRRSVYVSQDAGESWAAIAEGGKAK
jgi:hypothetical protein